MNRTEAVAVVLKGASLWGDWTYLHYYAAQQGASDIAKELAKQAHDKWVNWRNTQTGLNVERAQAIARITNEIITVTGEGE